MTVDAKYAGLPWIAHGQPDIYEAGELPEADQRFANTNIDEGMVPKEIEKINLSVSEAYKRFADCKLDSSSVDFSDSIAGSGKIGYSIEREEYDLFPPNARERETLVDRLQRLQSEVAQLLSDTASATTQAQAEPTSKITPTELNHLAESLNQQLRDLETNNLQPIDLNAKNDIVFNKVIAQLDNFKPEKADTTTSHLTYELYARQDLSKQVDLEKLSDLDRRIQRLEALIGQADPSKLSALTADTAQHTLLEAVSRLSARTSLFQSGHLDVIETRLSSLQTKLQSITEKRDAISDADTQNKVAELYELVKKWNDVANSLPMIVERLTELNEVHQAASEFNTLLTTVEQDQKSVETNLKTYSKLLEEVKQNLNENMETISSNISTIESRLA